MLIKNGLKGRETGSDFKPFWIGRQGVLGITEKGGKAL